ncbi:MAG: metal ABC transporter substrate-binding protein [Oscillospiraceae bacterium]|nr:metal ABC transporter substrate-binding protein [Oscillospiraceae bacterium]
MKKLAVLALALLLLITPISGCAPENSAEVVTETDPELLITNLESDAQEATTDVAALDLDSDSNPNSDSYSDSESITVATPGETASQFSSEPQPTSSSTREGEKLSIVCTAFPQFDWVRHILGAGAGNVTLTLLQRDGIDFHSYQPSNDDIVKIANCDLFIYGGGRSDGWAEEILQQVMNPRTVGISLMDLQGDALLFERYSDGMEMDDQFVNSNIEQNQPQSTNEFDEHVWLSLRNVFVFTSAITETLSTMDPENDIVYGNNLIDYLESMVLLDVKYMEAIEAANVKTILFGDHFPFGYLFNDYGLSYYAAFPGCSTEAEADSQILVFLSEKVDELSLKNVFVTENSDQSIARTIIDNSKAKNQEILVMNSMHSVTAEEMRNGITYLSVMEENLNVLKEAIK